VKRAAFEIGDLVKFGWYERRNMIGVVLDVEKRINRDYGIVEQMLKLLSQSEIYWYSEDHCKLLSKA
jgi:hypothetical protein